MKSAMSFHSIFLTAVLLVLVLVDLTSGHGMLMDPINRGSRWRNDASAPINYNDNGNFCGGYYVSE